MKKSIVTILCLLVIFSVLPVFAAEVYYEKGNTEFTVKAGISVPFFVNFFNNSAYGSKTFPEEMRLKIGGVGTLSYQGFINHKLAVGGEIGYQFNYSEAQKILTTVPFAVKFSFVPVQTGKFDLALHSDLGITYNKYQNSKFWMPFLSFEINPVFFFKESWGFGVNSGLYLNCELHSSKLEKSNALVGFIPATLTFTYRK